MQWTDGCDNWSALSDQRTSPEPPSATTVFCIMIADYEMQQKENKYPTAQLQFGIARTFRYTFVRESPVNVQYQCVMRIYWYSAIGKCKSFRLRFCSQVGTHAAYWILQLEKASNIGHTAKLCFLNHLRSQHLWQRSNLKVRSQDLTAREQLQLQIEKINASAHLHSKSYSTATAQELSICKSYSISILFWKEHIFAYKVNQFWILMRPKLQQLFSAAIIIIPCFHMLDIQPHPQLWRQWQHLIYHFAFDIVRNVRRQTMTS